MRKMFQFVLTICTVLTVSNTVRAQERPVSGTVLSDDDGTPVIVSASFTHHIN